MMCFVQDARVVRLCANETRVRQGEDGSDRRNARKEPKEAMEPLSIAVVGAGPSGFYTVDSLLKSGRDCRIDVIEALPAPYGLIRGGVAPDHQTTKRVSQSYARTAQEPAVRYYGNVELGRDLELDELRRLYDAVVLAVGAPLDRRLELPGGDKAGVYGSAAFVGWYNGHPDHVDLDPLLDRPEVVVIGNGNVALDVARVLVKTPAEMRASDLPEHAARAIHGAPIRTVHIVGRRGPADAKFTPKELKELGRLADCRPVVDADQLPADVPADLAARLSARDLRVRRKNLEILHGLAARPAGRESKRLHIRFWLRPLEVLGGERVETVRFERTRSEGERLVGTGETLDIPCGTVVAAIGYRNRPLPGLRADPARGTFANRRGRIATRLYVVGWAKRGPSGVIGSNKPDADMVAADIVAAGPAPEPRPGRQGLERLLRDRGIRWVSFEDWQRIDRAEIAGAGPESPRRKLVRIKDMLAVLDGAGDGAA